MTKKKVNVLIISLTLALVIITGAIFGILYIKKIMTPSVSSKKFEVEYQSAYSNEEQIERVNKQVDFMFSEMKECEFLQDYKVYPIYNFKNQPQFYLIELLGVYDVFDNPVVKELERNEWWQKPYTFSNIDALSEEIVPLEERDSYKEMTVDINQLRALNLERTDIQILGTMREDKLKNLVPHRVNDKFKTSKSPELEIEDFTYWAFKEEKVNNFGAKEFAIYSCSINYYKELNFFSNTYFNDKTSLKPNLLTNSPYQDKKIYFGMDKGWDNCLFAYEKDGEIYSLTDDPFSVVAGEKRVGCSKEYITKVASEYDKAVPKECYNALAYMGAKFLSSYSYGDSYSILFSSRMV